MKASTSLIFIGMMCGAVCSSNFNWNNSDHASSVSNTANGANQQLPTNAHFIEAAKERFIANMHNFSLDQNLQIISAQKIQYLQQMQIFDMQGFDMQSWQFQQLKEISENKFKAYLSWSWEGISRQLSMMSTGDNNITCGGDQSEQQQYILHQHQHHQQQQQQQVQLFIERYHQEHLMLQEAHQQQQMLLQQQNLTLTSNYIVAQPLCPQSDNQIPVRPAEMAKPKRTKLPSDIIAGPPASRKRPRVSFADDKAKEINADPQSSSPQPQPLVSDIDASLKQIKKLSKNIQQHDLVRLAIEDLEKAKTKAK